ncbi:hypothetical protein [Flavobacterium sp.]|uniref:hypothetical protein n=1 Tax=Flavobacterium sp. TaxID=239 RepID=UPI003750C1CC
MKKHLLFLALIILTVSCTEDNALQSNSTNSIARYSCAQEVININAGQNYLSGNVTIGNNSDFLYVDYNANENWHFTELHLYVGPLSGVPQKNGNPIPGQFPYKVTFNQLTSNYTFEIPMANVQKDANGCFVVAAHSSMRKTNENGSIIQTETGWAGYDDFSGNNWARYFNYCTCTVIK